MAPGDAVGGEDAVANEAALLIAVGADLVGAERGMITREARWGVEALLAAASVPFHARPLMLDLLDHVLRVLLLDDSYASSLWAGTAEVVVPLFENLLYPVTGKRAPISDGRRVNAIGRLLSLQQEEKSFASGAHLTRRRPSVLLAELYGGRGAMKKGRFWWPMWKVVKACSHFELLAMTCTHAAAVEPVGGF